MKMDAKTQDGKISGDLAFLLHDTYGFPIELTIEIVAEHGMSVDLDRFNELMQAQRNRSRNDYFQRRRSR